MPVVYSTLKELCTVALSLELRSQFYSLVKLHVALSNQFM